LLGRSLCDHGFKYSIVMLFLFKTLSIIDAKRGPSWSWSYGSWIYNYLCNQCLSPLRLRVQIPLRRGVLETTLCGQVCLESTIGLGVMVFNNTISVISRLLLVEETQVPGEKHWPVASHWQTWPHNVVSSTPRPCFNIVSYKWTGQSVILFLSFLQVYCQLHSRRTNRTEILL
jgi:hypothetical protein